MAQRVRTGWLLSLVFATYLCLDFSSPFVLGAFVFDADQSVDGVLMEDSGVPRDGLPVVVPGLDAGRVNKVSMAIRSQRRPRTIPLAKWIVVLQKAHARSSDRSSLSDVH